MTPSATAPMPGSPKKKPTAVVQPYWLSEFALIRLAVLTCLGTLGLSVAAVIASNWYLTGAAGARVLAQQARDAAYKRYANVDQEKQDIGNFQPRYLALRERGLIGDERRLDWVDAIRQIQVEHKLLPLSYEIAPQQPVTLADTPALGDYQLHASRMRLHMDLLHEGDLFDFFGSLQQRAYFGVQDCSIRRQSVASGVYTPTLQADCTLNWLTLKAGTVPSQQRRSW